MLEALRKMIKEAFRVEATLDYPIATDELWPQAMPDGWYRQRNGELVKIERTHEGLRRVAGGGTPSVIGLLWDKDGTYALNKREHPFDLVEYVGERI